MEPPAILRHPSTDRLSLAICGYIGGRYVLFKTAGLLPEWSVGWWVAEIAAALITAFGGATYYALLMKPSSSRSFAFKDLKNTSCALIGMVVSLLLPKQCMSGSQLEAFMQIKYCDDIFNAFDCGNCAILIAWGTSKALMDTAGKRWLTQMLYTVAATYIYSFGGGITRDVLAIAAGASKQIGNFDFPSVVIPAALGTLCYYILLLTKCPALLQLGIGLPGLFYIFYIVPKLI